jgi:hypothetical protein
MPETIGFLLLSALEVTEVAGFAVTASTYAVVGNAVLAAAAIAGSLALNKAPEQPKPQDGQLITRQAAAVRRRSYGLVRIAGPLLFSETKGGTRYQVIAINQGEIDSITRHFFNDAEGLLDGSGVVTNIYTLDGNHHVVVHYTTGTDVDPAFSRLISAFPTLWTAAHQGKGIAKVLIETVQPNAKDFTAVYPGGQPPIYRADALTAKVWDPRDPTQDGSNKSTWKFSSNPVLQILDYHRVPDGMSMAALDSVFFTAAAITEDWIPAANVCDEIMINKAGTPQHRYECAGNYALSDAPKDVLAAMFATCDGQTYQRPDGAIGIRIGRTIAPTVTLDDAHILSYDGMRRGPQASLVPINQITAKFTAASLDFQETDAEAWRDEDAIAAAGREESRDLDLHWVYLHPQARRLMKLAMHRANPEWAGRIVTDLDGVRAYNERYIHVVIAELGIDHDFEIVPGSFTIDVAAMTCSIGISALGQKAFYWHAATEEGDEPLPPPVSVDDPIDPPQGLAQTMSTHQIHLTWDAPSRFDAQAVAKYSLHSAADWHEFAVNPDGISADTPTLSAGSYDVEVIYQVGTLFSDPAALFNITVT